jgi:hypothetical protein
MRSENEITDSFRSKAVHNKRWYQLIRCSICTSFTWFRPIVLKEPVGAPEPLQEWILCQPCHGALLTELRRSSIRPPIHLRVAVGLVAAERSPTTYYSSRQQEFQREFTWLMWLLTLFAVLHLVILLILLVAPK